jgi:23S rRNA (uracil-5-)-methyltransferase RumA
VRAGTTVRLTVTGLDGDGAGVGLVEGARAPVTGTGAEASPGAVELHVPGALPGEEVLARIDGVSHHRPVAWATLIELVRRSADRVTPRCLAAPAAAAAGRCGGCVLQILDYPAQLAWKEDTLRRQLAVALDGPGVELREAVASPRTLGYRNKSKLVAAEAGGRLSHRLILGAFAPGTHDVVDLSGCAIAEAPLDAVAAEVARVATGLGVVAYDERRRVGSLRHVVLRSNAEGAVQITFVTSSPRFPMAADLADRLRAAHPEIVGVLHNVNPSTGNAIWGEVETLVWGAATLDDAIDGIRLRLSARAFFQANRQVAALAYRAIAAAVAPTPRDTVVDAYAGVGGIALSLARAGAGRVLGVESHAGAVVDATANAAANGLAHVATFVSGDAAEGLATVAGASVVILNPPRKGCAPAVLAEVARLRPRVLAYLSCSPATLARDLAVLLGLGYAPRTITPFDMLPHTPHLEVLVVLEPRSSH